MRRLPFCAWLSIGALAFICARTAAGQAPAAAPLTLDEVLQRAQANEPAFVAAAAENRALLLERKDARAALLPSLSYHGQVLYTQPNGQALTVGQTLNQPSPIFIANNAVREYASQGVVTENLGFSRVAAIRLADANAARASAELEVARRGLVQTVVRLFYTVSNGGEKLHVAERALAEADHFLDITQKREAQREVAHADVIKAQLQQQQRTRELADARLTSENARLELGVLLFADPTSPYALASNTAPALLPERSAIELAARNNNPEIRSALASLQVSEATTAAARAALLPELSLSAAYGIDASHFTANNPDGTRNLGYAAGATLDIPLWDWLTTERRIKESRLRETASKTLVTSAQRKLLASLAQFYAEAATAQAQLASLDASLIDARESLRLINLRYTDGESTVLEVVDAQATLIQTENARLDGIARYQLALAQLQTLTGRL